MRQIKFFADKLVLKSRAVFPSPYFVRWRPIDCRMRRARQCDPSV